MIFKKKNFNFAKKQHKQVILIIKNFSNENNIVDTLIIKKN